MLESAEKKPRVMSIKGFVAKSLSKAAGSATGFLQAHRTWLETGEVASITSPILTRMDTGELHPTPALDEIRIAVYNHMLAMTMRQGEEAMVRRAVDAALKSKDAKQASAASKEPRQPKAYVATIYTADGEIATRVTVQDDEELLQKEFNTPQEADRWTDRRLVTGESDWYGEVSHTKMLTRTGEPITMRIDRKDAIGRTFRSKSGAAMRVSKAAGKLSFGCRVKNHVSKFSHG